MLVNVPLLHNLQVLWTSKSWNVPTGHAEHVLAPDAEEVPFRQFPQKLCLVLDENFPLVHCMHPFGDVALVPLGQSSHPERCPFTVVPNAHGWHSVDPAFE
jgi:hypothetical protein